MLKLSLDVKFRFMGIDFGKKHYDVLFPVPMAPATSISAKTLVDDRGILLVASLVTV